MGAPKITADHVESVLDHVACGFPLSRWCNSPDRPSRQAIYDLVKRDEEFALRVARARDAGHLAIEDQIQDLADEIKDEHNPVEVQRKKLQIETRLKLLKIWDPSRYGDKVAIEPARPKSLGTRDEALKTLRESGLSVADIFGALTKPAQPIEIAALVENSDETAQSDDDYDLSDLAT
jgi:hypothetical protein